MAAVFSAKSFVEFKILEWPKTVCANKALEVPEFIRARLGHVLVPAKGLLAARTVAGNVRSLVVAIRGDAASVVHLLMVVVAVVVVVHVIYNRIEILIGMD